jgi:hypothetical protein
VPFKFFQDLKHVGLEEGVVLACVVVKRLYVALDLYTYIYIYIYI